MKKYVEVDAAADVVCNVCFDEFSCASECLTIKRLKELPNANVREDVKGEWECDSEWVDEAGQSRFVWKCSKCGFIRSRGWEYTKDGRKPTAKFCENCGADMRNAEQ